MVSVGVKRKAINVQWWHKGEEGTANYRHEVFPSKSRMGDLESNMNVVLAADQNSLKYQNLRKKHISKKFLMPLLLPIQSTNRVL
jgi:hypothetical protein